MRIHFVVDQETINKLEDAGTQLNIYTKDRSILIKTLCDKTTRLYSDLKVLLDTLLPFFERYNFIQSDVAKLSLQIYKSHYKGI